MEYPRLRAIRIVPVQHRGQRMFLLQDPELPADRALTVAAPALAVVQMMNGRNSLRDIQAAYFRRFGQMLFSDDLDGLIGRLDEFLLLDSDRFREHRRRLQEEFRALPVRAPVSAGTSYPADADALREYLRGIFLADGRPGLPERTRAGADLVGLIAPHIDTERGRAAYAAGYKELAERADAETYVLLGTNHQAGEAMYVATGKPFATPLGETAVDAELLAALEKRVSTDLRAEELVHRAEHSLEFQVLFLQFALAGRPHRILPILCNSPAAAARDGADPVDAPALVDFARALREAVAATGRRVVYVAGADLAHVGRQFGDPYPIDARVLRDCEDADRAMLAPVLERDPAAFSRSIVAERDRRRICGWGPIDTMLRCVDADSARLLHYGQWADNGGDGAVTFASIGFYRGGEEG